MVDVLSHYRACRAAPGGGSPGPRASDEDEADFRLVEPEVYLEEKELGESEGYPEQERVGPEARDKQDALDKALQLVLRRGYSYRVAASLLRVSSSTLRRHFVLKYGEKRHVRYMHNRSVLNLEQERRLVGEIDQLRARLPITKELIAAYAYMFCEKNRISHCFSREKRVAGKDWILHFLQRNGDVRDWLTEKSKP